MRFNFITKLDQEQFNKLPQLDRIEFRQKHSYLEKNKPNVGVFGFVNNMLIIIGFVILIAISLWNISSESSIIIMSLVPVIIKLTLLGFVFLFLLDLLFMLSWIKKKKELYGEYFEHKIEVKKKK